MAVRKIVENKKLREGRKPSSPYSSFKNYQKGFNQRTLGGRFNPNFDDNAKRLGKIENDAYNAEVDDVKALAGNDSAKLSKITKDRWEKHYKDYTSRVDKDGYDEDEYSRFSGRSLADQHLGWSAKDYDRAHGKVTEAGSKPGVARGSYQKRIDKLADKIYGGLERLGYTVYASSSKNGYEISRKFEKNLQPAKDYLTKQNIPFEVKPFRNRLYLTAILPEGCTYSGKIKKILESRESAREFLFNQPTPREIEDRENAEAEERRRVARDKLGLPQPKPKKKITGRDLLNQKTPREIEQEQEAERNARRERAAKILGLRESRRKK